MHLNSVNTDIETEETVPAVDTIWTQLNLAELNRLLRSGYLMAYSILNKSTYVPEPCVNAWDVAYQAYYNCCKTGTIPENYKSYYVTVAKRYSYKTAERYKKERRLDKVESTDQNIIFHPNYKFEQENSIASLHKALNQLKENQKTAITLRYFEGLTYQEIANQMKVSKRSVEGFLYRGLATLREYLSPETRSSSTFNLQKREGMYRVDSRDYQLEKKKLQLWSIFKSSLWSSLYFELLCFNSQSFDSSSVEAENNQYPTRKTTGKQAKELIEYGRRYAFFLLKNDPYQIPNMVKEAEEITYQAYSDYLTCIYSHKDIIREKTYATISYYKKRESLGTNREIEKSVAIGFEQKEWFYEAIDKLSNWHKRIFVRYYFEGLSYQEIADIEGRMSEKSVKAILSQSRTKLMGELLPF